MKITEAVIPFRTRGIVAAHLFKGDVLLEDIVDGFGFVRVDDVDVRDNGRLDLTLTDWRGKQHVRNVRDGASFQKVELR